MSEVDQTKPAVFISYSHADEVFKSQLLDQLYILETQGLVKSWSDENIRTGQDWFQEIEGALDNASVAVLLVSIDFLKSDFIRREELPALLKGRSESGLQVYPIIARGCPWQQDPFLAQFQARPGGNRVLASLSPAELEVELADYASEIAGFHQSYVRGAQPRAPGPVPIAVPQEQHQAVLRVPTGDKYAELEIGLRHRERDCYDLELLFVQSGTDKHNRRVRAGTHLDWKRLDALEADPRAYGVALGEEILSNEEVREAVSHAVRHARQELDVPLHLRIRIGPTEQELHWIRWETLVVPGDDDFLLIKEGVLFSRYLIGQERDWRGVDLRPEAPWNALCVSLSGPDGNAPDVQADYVASRAALSGTEAEVTPFHGVAALTLEALHHHIRDRADAARQAPYDVVYLIAAPQWRNGEAAVPFPDPAGGTEWVGGDNLASMLRRLGQQPRLVVVAPPGDPAEINRDASIRFALALTTNGIPAVLSATSPIHSVEWVRFLQGYLRVLDQHERSDLAYSAALQAATNVTERWSPTVFSRTATGRVSYRPGFLQDEANTWNQLKYTAEKGMCTPILGPATSRYAWHTRREMASRLADDVYYPMGRQERGTLFHVTQYVDVNEKRIALNSRLHYVIRSHIEERYGHLLPENHDEMSLDALVSLVGAHIRKIPNEAHGLLASLNCPLYITTNYSRFICDALRDRGKEPREESFSLDAMGECVEAGYKATEESPLVYHLFGRLSDLDSMIITEDDYFRFLEVFARDKDRIPVFVRRRLASTSLIFLGFRMQQWDFRLLYHTLRNMEGGGQRVNFPQVAVQIEPDDDVVIDPRRALQYVQRYLSSERINIFQGTAADFLRCLHEQM